MHSACQKFRNLLAHTLDYVLPLDLDVEASRILNSGEWDCAILPNLELPPAFCRSDPVRWPRLQAPLRPPSTPASVKRNRLRSRSWTSNEDRRPAARIPVRRPSTRQVSVTLQSRELPGVSCGG